MRLFPGNHSKPGRAPANSNCLSLRRRRVFGFAAEPVLEWSKNASEQEVFFKRITSYGRIRNRIFHSALLLVFLLIFACGSKEAKLSPLPADAVILAFGDSLTAGTGAPPGQSYPDVLQASINRKVVNAGVPGETSSQGLSRLPQALSESHPKLVILCHGGNDILRRLNPEETSKNLAGMINLIRKQGAQVVLIGVPKPKLIPETAAFYKKISEEMGVPLEGDVILTILSNRDMKSDYLHPNAAGYKQLAEAVASLLKKYGAVK